MPPPPEFDLFALYPGSLCSIPSLCALPCLVTLHLSCSYPFQSCLLVLLVLVCPLPRPRQQRLLPSRWRRLQRRQRRRPPLALPNPPQRMSPLYSHNSFHSALSSSAKGGRGRSTAKKPLTYVSLSSDYRRTADLSSPEEVPSDIDQEEEVEVVKAPPCVSYLYFSLHF